MARAGLNHWMLHNDQLADEYEAILELSPGFDSVRHADPNLTFYAPLSTSTKPFIGPVDAETLRDSAGSFNSPASGWLDQVGNNISRHEMAASKQPLGLLVEPPATNKLDCGNNYQPVSLDGFTLGGDPAATLSIVDDYKALWQAGLTKMCRGPVIEFDNRMGTASAWVNMQTAGVNVIPHAASAYARGEGAAQVNLTGGTVGTWKMLSLDYERRIHVEIPDQANRLMQVMLLPGAWARFILWSLEGRSIPSSVILQSAGPTSRDIDIVRYPTNLTPPFFNVSQGMAALLWRPDWNSTDQGNNTAENILSTVSPDAGSLMYARVGGTGNPEIRCRRSDGAGALVNKAWQQNGVYLIVLHWDDGPNQLQISVKENGIWLDSNVVPYLPGFESDSYLYLGEGLSFGHRMRSLYVWDVNRGLNWLKSFFSGVAN